MCLETGVYWKYNLSEEKVKKTIRSRKSGDRNGLYIEVLELMGMVMAAYVMLVIRRDRPSREGEIGRNDEDYWGVGADRRVEVPGKACEGCGELSCRWDNEVEGR